MFELTKSGGSSSSKRPSMFDPGSWSGSEDEAKASSNPLFASVNNITTSVTRSSKSLAQRAGLVEPEEPTVEDQVCGLCPTMSYKHRLIAFVGCCALGYVLEVVGTMVLIGGPTPANIRTFAVLYVLGNCIALLATCFWVGPKYMCKKMFAKNRRCATGFYLLMLVLVFALALAKVTLAIVLACLLVQVCAAIWYSASFVIKGRWMILQCCKATCFSPCPEVLNPIEKTLPAI